MNGRHNNVTIRGVPGGPLGGGGGRTGSKFNPDPKWRWIAAQKLFDSPIASPCRCAHMMTWPGSKLLAPSWCWVPFALIAARPAALYLFVG